VIEKTASVLESREVFRGIGSHLICALLYTFVQIQLEDFKPN